MCFGVCGFGLVVGGYTYCYLLLLYTRSRCNYTIYNAHPMNCVDRRIVYYAFPCYCNGRFNNGEWFTVAIETGARKRSVSAAFANAHNYYVQCDSEVTLKIPGEIVYDYYEFVKRIINVNSSRYERSQWGFLTLYVCDALMHAQRVRRVEILRVLDVRACDPKNLIRYTLCIKELARLRSRHYDRERPG